MKKWLLYVLVTSSLLFIVACNNGGTTSSEEVEAETDEPVITDNNEEESEETKGTERKSVDVTALGAGDAPDDQGDLEVRLEIKVEEFEEHYEVEGKSNLIPGTKVWVQPDSLDYTFINYGVWLDVEEDGSFSTELKHPQKYDTEIAISATFKSTATQPDEVYQHYGEDLGQITGPYTRIDYESAQVLEYMAQVLVSHEPIEGEFVVLESEEPVMNYPNDQGDVDVWLDNIQVEHDSKYYYITGRSNLADGAEVKANLEITDYVTIGYSDSSFVNSDGSFALRILYPEDIDDSAEVNVKIQFAPELYQRDHILDIYGEDGANLEGELVEELNGEKFVEIMVNI
ncbi:hypothetical protein [Alkalihalobacillus pseudalcaliphilus]|uniref:hypothetical protein n=1 Tax=Alkalihalobacillus pseudalcaliphilus TaxID=79884 RepID=UPI00064DF624|nr:hypothetical protein [Alkalihalobacillus pseudalcaliphilus]KMK75595.1 hypothetical protein AB990_09920 [Alkalihalobacillus pseudalcaliphilus]